MLNRLTYLWKATFCGPFLKSYLGEIDFTFYRLHERELLVKVIRPLSENDAGQRGQSSFDSICSRKETSCLYMIRFLPLLNRIGNRPWSTSLYMCCLLIPSSFAASESEYAWECSSGLWSSTAGRPYFIGFVRLMSPLALGVTNQCLSIVVKV